MATAFANVCSHWGLWSKSIRSSISYAARRTHYTRGFSSIVQQPYVIKDERLTYVSDLSYRQACGLMQYWIKRFETQGIAEPQLSGEYLMSHVCSISRSDLLNRPTRRLTNAQFIHFHQLCERRLKREPVQYLVGNWCFRDFILDMRPPILIPRPETEEFVDFIQQNCQITQSKPAPFLEIGCGTGAISIALLAAWSGSTCTAIDINPAAVELTSHNTSRIGLATRLQTEVSDIQSFSSSIKFQAVVSNPPYIPSQTVDQLEPEVRDYEDRKALDGGPDGMDIIRAILQRASDLTVEGADVFLEVDPSHPPMIQEWIHRHPNSKLKFIAAKQDLGGFMRFCHLKHQS